MPIKALIFCHFCNSSLFFLDSYIEVLHLHVLSKDLWPCRYKPFHLWTQWGDTHHLDWHTTWWKRNHSHGPCNCALKNKMSSSFTKQSIYFLYSEAEIAIINGCSKFMVTWRDCWAECAHEHTGVFDSAFYNELALCHTHRIPMTMR